MTFSLGSYILMEKVSFLVVPNFLRAGSSSNWAVCFLNMAPRHLLVDELIPNTNLRKIIYFFLILFFIFLYLHFGTGSGAGG